MQTAQRAAERLLELLNDPDLSPADILKASSLALEKLYPLAAEEETNGGNYEIIVKEE